jgi:hypothetical protein
MEAQEKILVAELKKHKVRFERVVKSFVMSSEGPFARVVAYDEKITLSKAKEKLFQENKQKYIERYLEIMNDLYDAGM